MNKTLGLVTVLLALLPQTGNTAAKPRNPSAVDRGTALSPGQPLYRTSTVSSNGMPKNIVPKGADWNFGPGSLWSHRGWQYAAYWDDARQVSVARRQLPDGAWSVVSLPGYQRSAAGDRGKGGPISLADGPCPY